jgi:osmotically-inducible protein OsmY
MKLALALVIMTLKQEVLTMKPLIMSLVVASLISAPVVVRAEPETSSVWKDKAKDAWIDGKAEATLLFNTHLNSFDINTDVKDGIVILTGKVETSIDSKLAEELIVGIDGVVAVDNRLSIIAADERNKQMAEETSSKLTDAKIATVIKSRLLMDTDISGFDIDVDVENTKVFLKGQVASEEERMLAIQIAINTADVSSVEDKLTIRKP